METIETLTLPQRVVLLAVATLDRDEETPAPVNVITRRAREYADDLDDLGTLTEAEVDSALNALEADGIVSVPSMDDNSPVGKGRPAYEPAEDADTILNALADDEQLGDVVDRLEAA